MYYTLHINAQLYWAISLAQDLPSQPGENDTVLNISLWMERDFSPMQYVRDHDVVNLFKCKPVQFNYQSIIKFASTTPVLTTQQSIQSDGTAGLEIDRQNLFKQKTTLVLESEMKSDFNSFDGNLLCFNRYFYSTSQVHLR